MAENYAWKFTIDPVKEMELLGTRIEQNIMRKAIRAGAKEVAPTVSSKASAHVRSGWLVKSIWTKISTRVKGVVAAIIGARRGVEGEYKGEKVVPAKYAYLVEGGHAGPKPAPAYPILEDALNETKAAYIAKVTQVTASEIERYLSK